MQELREIQKREGGTLGDLVSRLLTEALARRPKKRVYTGLRVDDEAHARIGRPGRQGRGVRHPQPRRSGGRAVSFSCDVNVLLYASDSASPVHEPARRCLQQLASSGDLFCLGWPTIMSYLRITRPTPYYSQRH